MFPQDPDAFVAVHEAVVVGQPEGDGAGVEPASEAQAVAGDGSGATEVQLDGVVEFVGVDAVDLCDVIVAVG